MELDAAGLEILHREECLALIRTAPIGRLAFTDRALPAIQPVNFALDGQDVIILTASGSKLAAAAAGSIVAFQVDQIDAATRTGWSVTLIGKAQAVCDPAEVNRLSRLPLRTWAPGRREHFIRIRDYLIGGRRLEPDTELERC